MQKERRADQASSHLAQSLRRDLSLGLAARQAAVLETKRSWYL